MLLSFAHAVCNFLNVWFQFLFSPPRPRVSSRLWAALSIFRPLGFRVLRAFPLGPPPSVFGRPVFGPGLFLAVSW